MIVQADALRLPFADQTVDLVCGSPPYCDARTYGINAQRNAHEWVAWMLEVTTEALRVSKGAVIWVAAGVTRDRTYWPACEGLMWEWFKRGGSSYRPCYWHRVGIPGSGGDQWFRADVEYAMCFKRPGALPWAENTAMGHKPKWGVGGTRPHIKADGSKTGAANYRGVDRANPGNLLRIDVGGGKLGHDLAHLSEAPYPDSIPSFFIASLCPPGGCVLDPFGGSGTTAHAAKELGRRYVTSDIRRSQCELSRKRLNTVTAALPGFYAEASV